MEGGRALLGLEGGGEALAIAATAALATGAEAQAELEVAQRGEGDEVYWKPQVEMQQAALMSDYQ